MHHQVKWLWARSGTDAQDSFKVGEKIILKKGGENPEKKALEILEKRIAIERKNKNI